MNRTLGFLQAAGIVLALAITFAACSSDDGGGGNIINGDDDAWAFAEEGYPNGSAYVFRPDGQLWAGTIDFSTMTMYYRIEGTYSTSGNKITLTIPGDEDCDEGCQETYNVSDDKLFIENSDDKYVKIIGLIFVYNPSRS